VSGHTGSHSSSNSVSVLNDLPIEFGIQVVYSLKSQMLVLHLVSIPKRLPQ